MPASTSLPTAVLGSTGYEITRVGFGAWQAGGPDWSKSWGPQDDDDSVAAIRRAVEAGVTWVDTAPVYGLGHSEEVVRRALEPFSDDDRPYVFTKCGLVWSDDDRTPRAVATAGSLRGEVEDSLRRLGVEALDLLQVHRPPDDGTPVVDYWDALVGLKDAGLVRALGLSNHDAQQLQAAQGRGQVDTLQPPFSALAREAGGDLIPWCVRNGTGVIVYSPLASGLLSGSMSLDKASAFDPGDWRSDDPRFSGKALHDAIAVQEVFREIAEGHGVSTAAAAVAWTLAWTGVTGAIVGARTPDQVDGWVPAGSVTLTARDLDAVAGVLTSTGAGSGPKHPTEATGGPGAGGRAGQVPEPPRETANPQQPKTSVTLDDTPTGADVDLDERG